MFSTNEKKKIAAAVEKVLLEINHPEMPNSKPSFKLHVDGKASWSWADITPNWTYGKSNVPTTTSWNENPMAVNRRLNNGTGDETSMQWIKKILPNDELLVCCSCCQRDTILHTEDDAFCFHCGNEIERVNIQAWTEFAKIKGLDYLKTLRQRWSDEYNGEIGT